MFNLVDFLLPGNMSPSRLFLSNLPTAVDQQLQASRVMQKMSILIIMNLKMRSTCFPRAKKMST